MISGVGRTYEELEVGAVYRSRFGRTVLEADNVWFTLLTLNTNPIHFDAQYAAQTEWKQPLVDSTFTLALVTGLSVVDVSERAVNLGWREVTLPAPVFAGDTIRAETEIPYAEIPGWPVSTAVGHAGKLIIGKLGELPLAVMSGRAHLYEGNTPAQVTHGIMFP